MANVVFSLTPEAQNDAVSESLFLCAEVDSKEDRAVLENTAFDDDALTMTLRNEYRAKHGANPDDSKLDDFVKKEYGPGTAGAAGRSTGKGPGLRQPRRSETP